MLKLCSTALAFRFVSVFAQCSSGPLPHKPDALAHFGKNGAVPFTSLIAVMRDKNSPLKPSLTQRAPQKRQRATCTVELISTCHLSLG